MVSFEEYLNSTPKSKPAPKAEAKPVAKPTPKPSTQPTYQNTAPGFNFTNTSSFKIPEKKSSESLVGKVIDKVANTKVPNPITGGQMPYTIGQNANFLADATYRPVARAGFETTQTLAGDNKPYTPKGKLGQALLGSAPLTNLNDPSRTGSKIEAKTGIPGIGLAFGIGATALDATSLAPSGAAKNVGKNLAVKTGKTIVKNADEVADIARMGMKLLGPGDPEKRVADILKVAIKQRGKQENLYSAERSLRVKAGKEAYEAAGGGEKGLQSKLGKFAGEYQKVDFPAVRNLVSDSDVKFLLDKIENTKFLNEFEKLPAQKAMAGLFQGKLPTESEIAKLKLVFKPELVDELVKANNIPLLTNLGTLPRALKSTLDVSAPLRQGLLLAPSHPKDFARSFKNMFGYAFSQKKLDNFNNTLKNRPNFLKMRESGLEFTDFQGGVGAREEAFLSSLAEQLPDKGGFLGGLARAYNRTGGRVVRGSSRAYTGFLNNLRADVFDTIYNGLSDAEKANPQIVKDIGSFINAASGRGNFADAFSLPKVLGGASSARLGTEINRGAPVLNIGFFSPRLIASRMSMLNPFYYTKLSGPARKEAAKSAVGTVVMGMTVLGMAKLAGADVGTDPRSADFGKIKFGNTRYDIWGGFQQYAVLIARMLTGESVNSSTGKVRDLSEGYKAEGRAGALINFTRSKLAPIPAATWDILEGKNMVGEKTTIPSVAKGLVEPFILSDMEDTIKEYGALGPIVSMPGLFGIGSQTYKPQKSSSGGITRSRR